MALRIHHIVLDCVDASRVATFWSEVLGRDVLPDASADAAFIGAGEAGEPGWLFFSVPEPKTAKNRMHVDFESADRDAEVERLLALGATRVADHDEWDTRWTVLQDPEGNEFCVSQRPAGD
ncbi:VOC family protein [Leifsonia kafniensis]|uniref:VOC family protein n=1 Tax=Leifsonia kafniensis TaxID=475957 RepID=A0ABP7L2L1_9MICO